MSILTTELICFDAASVPTDDVSTSGGAISTTSRPDLTQWASNNIAQVVSDGTDTRTVTITGRLTTGVVDTEVLTLNGTTPVSGAKTWERVQSAVASVTLRNDAGTSSAWAKAHGVSPTFAYLRALNGFAATLSASAAASLEHNPQVVSVTLSGQSSPGKVARAAPTGDPTQLNAPWNLDRIDQAKAHLDGKYAYWPSAGLGVHAYIIDSGIRSTHSDFTGRVGAGTDFVGDGHGVEDCFGHGTHVSGILGGTTYGVAKRITLHPVRVFDCLGSPVDDAVTIAALDWVITNGVHPAVINMSLGGDVNAALNAAVENAIAAGFVVAVAAMQDGRDACLVSPASAPDALTVGATNSTDGAISNGGLCVDLYAPGSAMASDWFTGDNATNVLWGTSMATPHVAGAAALYLAEHPTATPSAVTMYLVSTATTGTLVGLPLGSPNRLVRTHAGTP